MNYSKIKSDAFFLTKGKPWKGAAPDIKSQIIGYDINMMMDKVDFQKESIGSIQNHFRSQTTFCSETAILTNVFSPFRKDFLKIPHTKK